MLVTTALKRDEWKVYLLQRIKQNEEKLLTLKEEATTSSVTMNDLNQSIMSDREKIVKLDNFFKN